MKGLKMEIPVLLSRSFENLAEVERAMQEINRLQTCFALSLMFVDWIPEACNKKWLDQNKIFVDIEKRLGDEPVCAVVQSPLKLDYFADSTPHIYIISTADWNTKYAPPPLELYIIFMLACGLVDLACRLPDDIGDALLHEPPIGCISDYNSDKTSIRVSMTNPHICERCRTALLDHGLSAQAFDATNQILRFVETAMKPYVKSVFMFILGQPIDFEETLYSELKGITSKKPEARIVDEAEEYAIAFLNREGGRIFWGIRSDRIVEGVKLDSSQRDLVRQLISQKLAQIQPSRPQTDFHLEIHSVRDDEGNAVADLNVIELAVARGNPEDLYASAKSESWIKTPGGTQKLNYNQKVAEIRRRAMKFTSSS
jgi:hypothetical protein